MQEAKTPPRVGVVGVGTIGSAFVRGVAKAKLFSRIVCSPRGEKNVNALLKELPGLVDAAKSNQEVVDKCNLIVLAVLPSQALIVLEELKFRKEQEIITLVATISTSSILKTVQPCTRVARAVPLPGISSHGCPTIVAPKGNLTAEKTAKNIFDKIGGTVLAKDDDECAVLQAVTTLMGPFYQMQQACSEWLTSKGIDAKSGNKYISCMFGGVASDAVHAIEGQRTFQNLVAEQTPGGLNENCIHILREKGCFEVYKKCLDASLGRLLQRPSSG